jgi:hypothetical protein
MTQQCGRRMERWDAAEFGNQPRLQARRQAGLIRPATLHFTRLLRVWSADRGLSRERPRPRGVNYRHDTKSANDTAWLDEMDWVRPQLPIQAVNRAGRGYIDLINEPGSVDQWAEDQWRRYRGYVAVMDHWRACHAYPLNALQINLRHLAQKFDDQSLVAQRTKRLISIGYKLLRNPSMKLTQMQDVGGCRAVLSSATAVKNLDKFIREESRMNHKFATVDNYIATPKVSGYRGIHLVYRFHSRSDPASQYNGLRFSFVLNFNTHGRRL